MNVATLVDRMRVEILDDDIEPYLWSDDEIINVLNDTINELAEENLIIADQTTTALTEVKLVSGVNLHPVSEYVVMARYGRLKSNGYEVKKTTEDWLNANITEWREPDGSAPSYFAPAAAKGYLSIYPKYDSTGAYEGDADITFTAATKMISRPGEDFSTLTVGSEIMVDGSTSNDGYYTIGTAGTDSIKVTETLVNESNSSATIRMVRDTLILTVNRMPLTPFTVASIALSSEITDVSFLHHSKFFNGMAKRLYLKPDSETYDKNKAEYHRNLFEMDKRRIRRSNILLKMPAKALTIRSGTGMGN